MPQFFFQHQVDGERRMEVEYVDRDRAAAVVIGTKDIVNDLKATWKTHSFLKSWSFQYFFAKIFPL